jgi:radical SAM superfamily enzyme YgiQ (UPF0313 family)
LVRLDRALEPKRNGFDAAAYPVHAIVTSRGCPRRCIFCTLGYQQGRERVRPIGTVLAEVSALREHFGVNEFFVHDDNFSADRRRAKALCAALSAAGLDVRWGCEVVARDVDEELAEALVAAGCSHVMLGVESGNAEVLRATKKGIRLDHAENAVRTFAAVGMPSITCSFIVGHPQDTPETVRETFDFALRLKSLGATKIRVGAMTPFPGTALYHSPEEHGIRILTKDWVEYVPTKIVMETRHLEKGEIGSLLVEGLLQFADELQRCNS